MYRLFLSIVFLALSAGIASAESPAADPYVGKWVSGDITFEIEAGIAGYEVKYDRPQGGDGLPVFQTQQQGDGPIETLGTAYKDHGVLFIQLSGTNWVAILNKSNELRIGSTLLKHA